MNCEVERWYWGWSKRDVSIGSAFSREESAWLSSLHTRLVFVFSVWVRIGVLVFWLAPFRGLRTALLEKSNQVIECYVEIDSVHYCGYKSKHSCCFGCSITVFWDSSDWNGKVNNSSSDTAQEICQRPVESFKLLIKLRGIGKKKETVPAEILGVVPSWMRKLKMQYSR